MAIWEVGSDRDPFPALGANGFGFGLELVDHEAVEQGSILEPTAVVMLEQVAHHDTAGDLIGVKADELGSLVGDANGPFGELVADVIRLFVVAVCKLIPELLLARMIVRDGERHQLLQRHPILGVHVEEFLGDRRKLQALLDYGGAHIEPGGDLVLAEAFVA